MSRLRESSLIDGITGHRSAGGVDHALRNIQMGDMKALARERNREAARPGSGIENRAHTVQPRRDLALQVRLLNDVVEEEALAPRFLSRLGRKIPKSLTDIFRIWHRAPHLMTRSSLIFAARFTGN